MEDEEEIEEYYAEDDQGSDYEDDEKDYTVEDEEENDEETEILEDSIEQQNQDEVEEDILGENELKIKIGNPMMTEYEKSVLITERIKQLNSRYQTKIPELIALKDFESIKKKILIDKFPNLKDLKDFNNILTQIQGFERNEYFEIEKYISELNSLERLIGSGEITKSYQIAELELFLGKLPKFSIIRNLNNKKYEKWKYEDFKFIYN